MKTLSSLFLVSPPFVDLVRTWVFLGAEAAAFVGLVILGALAGASMVFLADSAGAFVGLICLEAEAGGPVGLA